jgi:ATP-dependent RNA helicase DeaD
VGSGTAVLIGTPGRIIDHLRRGSLQLEALETLLVSLPEGEARESTVRDVQFVLEKCPSRRQTVLLGRPPLAGQDELLALAHHPEVLSADDGATLAVPAAGAPSAGAPPREAIALEGVDREEALARLLLCLPATPALVLHGGRTGGEKAARRLRDLFLRAETLPPGGGAPARRRAIAGLAAGTLDALLVPLPVPDDVDTADAGLVVWLDLPQPRDARRAVPASGRLVAFAGANQARDLAKLEETIGVTMTKIEPPGDAEMVRGALDRVLVRMAEEDPAELSRLTALVRARVPLLRRTQVAAFLLKAQLPRFAARAPALVPAVQPAGAPPARERGEGGGRREGRGERPAARQPTRQPSRQPTRPSSREAAGGFTQLFVSAGRNRRVFASDLTALFKERLGLSAAEIGAVRVFEKYSFVEVASSRAAEAVQRLTGVDLKGRQLNVEVAKRKAEKPAR